MAIDCSGTDVYPFGAFGVFDAMHFRNAVFLLCVMANARLVKTGSCKYFYPNILVTARNRDIAIRWRERYPTPDSDSSGRGVFIQCVMRRERVATQRWRCRRKPIEIVAGSGVHQDHKPRQRPCGSPA